MVEIDLDFAWACMLCCFRRGVTGAWKNRIYRSKISLGSSAKSACKQPSASRLQNTNAIGFPPEDCTVRPLQDIIPVRMLRHPYGKRNNADYLGNILQWDSKFGNSTLSSVHRLGRNPVWSSRDHTKET